jgi:CBS domain-containing protein
VNDQATSPELMMVVEFLATCPPFDLLKETTLHKVAQSIEINYYRRGHICGSKNPADLRIIRSGAIDIIADDKRLLDRMGEGESYILSEMFLENPNVTVILYEDSLIYTVPEVVFKELSSSYRDVDRHYHRQLHRRLRRAARYTPEPNNLMRRVDSIMTRDVLAFHPDQSIQHVALAMSERRVSSGMILLDGVLVGIITDRDLRSRVVAEGLDVTTPIGDVMTVAPKAMHVDATLFDATLFMVRNKIHHLPIVAASDDRTVLGIITTSDLMLARQDDPVNLVQHLSRALTIDAMRSVVDSLPVTMAEWVNAGIKSHQISHFLTAISDAVTKRLIELAKEQYGPEPVPFAWLGFGSQGRAEQLINADQDNGMVIHDSMRPEHADWFKRVAKFVCDGLNECGYMHCPGKIMAMTDAWRLPLKGWCYTVDGWTHHPSPDAVMRVSIFFDVRHVYGDESLTEQLQQHMLSRTSKNGIFLAALAENVLQYTPPLGVFRRFLVERNGEHKDSLNLKKRGVIPIIDMMRIHSLAHHISAVNTTDRINALIKAKVMTVKDGRNMQDAFDFIMQLRVENMAATIQTDGASHVSNYLDPDKLPDVKRRQLKDAFEVVHDAQGFIKTRYRSGMA